MYTDKEGCSSLEAECSMLKHSIYIKCIRNCKL